MSTPTSRREVFLIDAGAPGRPFVRADLYRDYPPSQLEVIEESWAAARERSAQEGKAAGLAPTEHSHWDWRNKVDRVEAGRYMLVAVEWQMEPQGVMTILRTPRRCRDSANSLVYVDYVESAPWNLKGPTGTPRFLGVGTVLIAEAVRISLEMGFDGRIGLHSLPQAEAFYERCRMTDFGPDPHYFDLAYYEHSGTRAMDWLASVGGV